MLGKIEHWVVSNFKAMIPESVKEKWNGYWAAVKKVESEKMGDDEITDKVEMVGWGVEEAQQRNKEEASTYNPHLHGGALGLTKIGDRFSNTAGVGLRYPQELHLRPSAANCSGYAQSCQGPPGMGLEHWKEKGLKENL